MKINEVAKYFLLDDEKTLIKNEIISYLNKLCPSEYSERYRAQIVLCDCFNELNKIIPKLTGSFNVDVMKYEKTEFMIELLDNDGCINDVIYIIEDELNVEK